MEAILSLNDISKEFAGVAALKHIDLDIYPGEVHALVGENGAGKSTLMKIISAVYRKSSGTMIYKGSEVDFKSTDEAKKNGISIIHQEFNLFPNLSVAENIFMDTINQDEAKKAHRGRISWKQVYEEARGTLSGISDKIRAEDLVEDLNVQSKQVVEIAKALHAQAEILIMDEPSAALPENEVENMFQVIRNLRNQGAAIIYVSHHLGEVFEIADKVTVLRNGAKVDTVKVKDIEQQDLIKMMIGNEIGNLYGSDAGQSTDQEKNLIEVNRLKFGETGEVSFCLHPGEIVSLFGIIGAGAQSVSECLFGLKIHSGEIKIDGKPVRIDTPQDAMKSGVGYIPGDRRNFGLISERTVKENITLPILKELSNRAGVIQTEKETPVVEASIQKLKIKTTGPDQITNYLSGGNQQKIVIAKWLSIQPKILIMVEPTRGVDIGAMSEIYELIRQLARSGMGILMVSSDMPEVLGMSDRILVMRNGRIVSEYPRGSVTQRQLLHEVTRSE